MTQKPVVCHLIERLVIGGAETLLYRLASGQRHGKYRPIVCALEGGPIEPMLIEQGVPCFTLGRKRPSIKNAPRFALQMTAILRALGRTLNDQGVRIIHAHLPDSNLLAAAIGAYYGMAVIGTYHGLHVLPSHRSRVDPRNALRRHLYRLAGRFSDRTIAVSEPIRQRLCSEFGLRADRTTLVLNGVDTAAFASAQAPATLRHDLGVAAGRRIIACVGRLVPAKNQHVLIEAMNRVIQRFPEAALVLVGDGPRASALQEQVTRAGLEKDVFFVRGRTDVAEILSISDLFVLPSDAEGIPLSLIEAMASGTPVIATSVPGNLDVIGDANRGVLVPRRDPSALAKAIVDLLSHPDRARSLALAGQTHVRTSFDIRGTLDRIEAIYDDVLQQRESRANA